MLLASPRLLSTTNLGYPLGRKKESLKFEIAELPGKTLGQLENDTFYLDRDAAGLGWILDKTLSKDEEFSRGNKVGLFASSRRKSNSGEQVDPLTAVMHEIGHFLGIDHSHGASHSVMAEALKPGIRVNPTRNDFGR